MRKQEDWQEFKASLVCFRVTGWGLAPPPHPYTKQFLQELQGNCGNSLSLLLTSKLSELIHFWCLCNLRDKRDSKGIFEKILLSPPNIGRHRYICPLRFLLIQFTSYYFLKIRGSMSHAVIFLPQMNRTLRLSILPTGFKEKVVHLSENRSLISRQSTVYHKIL